MVHIIVAIFGKPADEMNIRFRHGQGRIALEQCLIVGAGYRVVGVALAFRIFPHH